MSAPKTHLLRVAAIGTALLALHALAPSTAVADTPHTATRASTPPFDELRMSRSGCYGTCPIYTITVSGDGHVTWHGENFVRVLGPAEAQLSAVQMQALRIELDRADLTRLRDTYASPSDGCPALWTDAPGVELSLRRGSSVKTIHHYLGCMDPKGNAVYPAALATLELRIDEIVRTREWVEQVAARRSQ